MIATAVSAAVVVSVAWAGRAFIRWIEKRQERLEKRDALEHEQRKGGR